jgi:hypothetical protein
MLNTHVVKNQMEGVIFGVWGKSWSSLSKLWRLQDLLREFGVLPGEEVQLPLGCLLARVENLRCEAIAELPA